MEQELQKEQKCSFYALEQLRQTAEAILRGSQRLLKCRAGVEKYRTAQPQRAYAYYLELQKTRGALLAALGDAQRYLLELDEPMLVKTAEQLQMGLRRFDLMSRAYKPVYEVLTGFAKSLPQTDTVNAAVIGRLMNHVRMGYYPTDPENITHILRGIQFPEGVTTNLLDPCCGCGKALRQLANGNNCYTYGMELDEHRAEEAQTRLHRVGFGSFFHSQISREKQLHKALDIAVIGLGEILAAQLRLKHGDGPVVALDREGERARRLFFIFPAPDAEGDERRVQQRLIFERCFDPKIVHVVSSQSFVSGQRRSS